MAEIVERAVRDLVPYARKKNDAVVDQMAASIREFGFKVPILALSDGTIIDGHLRLKAAQKLKLESVPVILCDEWTPAQVKVAASTLQSIQSHSPNFSSELSPDQKMSFLTPSPARDQP